MARILVRIVLFILPLAIAFVLAKVPERCRYAGLKDDCSGQGLWLHDRLHLNSDPVDLAVIGSSRALNGIDDRELEAQMDGVSVANIAYCRFGENLNYILFKRLLEEKQPRLVIIEVREKMERKSHPVFPHIASFSEELMSPILLNTHYLSDIYTAITYRLELIQDQYVNRIARPAMRMEDFGHFTSSDTLGVDAMETLKMQDPADRGKKPDNQWISEIQHRYPETYIRKMAELAAQEGVEIVFLYLPKLSDKMTQPEEAAFYSGMGSLLIPPDSIVCNPDFRHDVNHLNSAGAKALTTWLAGELRAKSQ